MNVIVRDFGQLDIPFMWEMLYQALYVPDGEKPFPREILENPNISKYASEWGRHGDIALIAETQDKKLMGIVWLRHFDESNQGYGYIDDTTPELTISIVDGYRGQGIGSLLLREIESRAIEFGYQAISLSVDPNNPARTLYERFGYVHVGWSETSWIMKKTLD